jgi:threonine dehydrogenase-like Zn-dependent dehydrogenase
MVRALRSGVSRGTETLVFPGGVPPSQYQTANVVPAGAVTVVPDDIPPARAVPAGTVETAVNALWDAASLVGDRVAVVGAGMVGCCVARLLARFPAVEVTTRRSACSA